MKIFKIFFYVLFLVFISASDPYFGTETLITASPTSTPQDVIEQPWMSEDSFRDILEDYDNRVSDSFLVTPFYYPNVNFWFLVYTQFPSSSMIIHDKNNLSLIYSVLDFSQLHQRNISSNAIYILQRKLTDEKISELRNLLRTMIENPFLMNSETKKMYDLFKKAKINLSAGGANRVLFFKSLFNNLRSQTGQKNFIQEGLHRSVAYENFIKSYFRAKKLPTELMSIPFLESSFNPRAHSKANALGVWQFMPFISKSYFPPKTNHVDYRSSVAISSIAAGFLMSENIKIMKSWDLAVTAYNSGTKHLLKTKKELTKNASLEDVIKHSKSSNFGFASKNFYSEFLALAHALAYREVFFEAPKIESVESNEINFYMSKCSVSLHKALDDGLLNEVKLLNNHLHPRESKIPKNYFISSRKVLPKKFFSVVKNEHLHKHKPKDWEKLLRGQSCSTK